MALLNPQAVVRTGLAPAYTAVNASDTVAATPGVKLVLHVKNANASACTVTLVDSGRTPAGSAAANPTVSVPATTGDRLIALTAEMADPATGLITVNYSVTATVSAALLTVAV